MEEKGKRKIGCKYGPDKSLGKKIVCCFPSSQELKNSVDDHLCAYLFDRVFVQHNVFLVLVRPGALH